MGEDGNEGRNPPSDPPDTQTSHPCRPSWFHRRTSMRPRRVRSSLQYLDQQNINLYKRSINGRKIFSTLKYIQSPRQKNRDTVPIWSGRTSHCYRPRLRPTGAPVVYKRLPVAGPDRGKSKDITDPWRQTPETQSQNLPSFAPSATGMGENRERGPELPGLPGLPSVGYAPPPTPPHLQPARHGSQPYRSPTRLESGRGLIHWRKRLSSIRILHTRD